MSKSIALVNLTTTKPACQPICDSWELSNQETTTTVKSNLFNSSLCPLLYVDAYVYEAISVINLRGGLRNPNHPKGTIVTLDNILFIKQSSVNNAWVISDTNGEELIGVWNVEEMEAMEVAAHRLDEIVKQYLNAGGK